MDAAGTRRTGSADTGRKRPGFDVGGYEHASVQDAMLNDLRIETLHFGLPEEWVKLDDAQKEKMRGIIEEMRQLQSKCY